MPRIASGPYKYVDHIGSGGFGIVDTVEGTSGRIFARKTFSLKNQSHTLTPDLVENVKKRFKREAIYQSGTAHKNIVPVYDQNLSVDPPFFIMPKAICSLESELEVSATVDGRYMGVMMDIIAGLEEIHKRGIFHRDLKPGNVLKFPESKDPAQFYYAITDFGLMSQREVGVTTLTNTEMQKGSDYYTAPEVANGLKNANAQSDIYSLGCILHDMVGNGTMRVPFQEINITGPFAGILHKCTKTDPKKRFKSVASLRDALISIGTGIAVKSSEASDFVNMLSAVAPLSKENWEALITFVEENISEPDGHALLRMLTEDHLIAVCTDYPDLARMLAVHYALFTRERSFNFNATDGLAARLEIFIQHCPIETKAECLMAMLYLGTSHNRFYVESKFLAYIQPEMDTNLANRVSLEFLVDDDQVCRAIAHLEFSISAKRELFHPILVETLEKICH